MTLNNIPSHAPMDQFDCQGDELLAGGLPMEHIARLVGQSPFYVYDRTIINRQVTALKQQLPDAIELHYAIKANPYPPLVHHMKGLCDGFDVASQQEMLLALQSGMPGSEISFAGPGKQVEELTAAIIAGVTLNVESETELDRLISLSKTLKRQARVALRVNPAFELKSSGMKMTGGAKPFGIDAETIPALLTRIHQAPVEFRGLHIFSGSQNLNPEALIDAHNNTFALAAELLKDAPEAAPCINIGGGFGIPYFPGEQRLSLGSICDNLQQLMVQYQPVLGGARIIIELGRYLVAEAGLYVTRVTDKKISRGETFAICDGGLHHHLANSGNFGQVLRKNYPAAIANKMQHSAGDKITLVGPLCTPLDILANKMHLPDVEVGDWLVIYQSGAYGPSASPSAFLGHPAVAEILL